jgi:hypothetical protein
MTGAPIIWYSKIQSVVALSTCEAELIALCEIVTHLQWLVNFLTEAKIQFSTPIPVFIDNQAALRLSKNPVNHKRSKHIDLKYWHIISQLERNIIAPIYVPTCENVSDIFTKSPDAVTFRKHMKMLVVKPSKKKED